MYLVTADEIRQITQDHSLVEEMIRKGEISRDQAKTHPSRNIITRAVGVQGQVNADCFEVPVREGEIAVLCSDGLTNMINDETIRSILLKSDISLDEKARQLIDEANKNGGEDNISLILVDPFTSEV